MPKKTTSPLSVTVTLSEKEQESILRLVAWTEMVPASTPSGETISIENPKKREDAIKEWLESQMAVAVDRYHRALGDELKAKFIKDENAAYTRSKQK